MSRPRNLKILRNDPLALASLLIEDVVRFDGRDHSTIAITSRNEDISIP
jgi:hypothetical protein